MIYVNKKTGATIDSPCLLSGEDWELISEAAETEEVEAAEAEAIESEEVPEEADAKKTEKTNKATPKKRNTKKGE